MRIRYWMGLQTKRDMIVQYLQHSPVRRRLLKRIKRFSSRIILLIVFELISEPFTKKVDNDVDNIKIRGIEWIIILVVVFFSSTARVVYLIGMLGSFFVLLFSFCEEIGKVESSLSASFVFLFFCTPFYEKNRHYLWGTHHTPVLVVRFAVFTCFSHFRTSTWPLC